MHNSLDPDFDQPWLKADVEFFRPSTCPTPYKTDPPPSDDCRVAEPPPRRIADDYWP